MMKRIRAHPRDRPSSRLVMQRGTYESSCRAVTRRRKGGGNYNPRYARYLLFCSFGDAFINQTPSPRRSSSAFFKLCSNIRHAATGVLHSFFFSIFAFDLSFASRPAPCASHTNALRRSGKSESDGILSKPLHELAEDSLLSKKFVLLRCETQILFYKVLQYWIRI